MLTFKYYLPTGRTCCCLLQIIFKWLLLLLQCAGNEKKISLLFISRDWVFVHACSGTYVTYYVYWFTRQTRLILRGLWHSLHCCRLFCRMFSVCAAAATTTSSRQPMTERKVIGWAYGRVWRRLISTVYRVLFLCRITVKRCIRQKSVKNRYGPKRICSV